jgi:hypothetical protein
MEGAAARTEGSQRLAGWAEGHHDVALVDGDGKLVAKRRINETLEEFGE